MYFLPHNTFSKSILEEFYTEIIFIYICTLGAIFLAFVCMLVRLLTCHQLLISGFVYNVTRRHWVCCAQRAKK